MRRVGRSSPLRSPLLDVGEEVQVRSHMGHPVRLEWHERVLPVLCVESTWCVNGRWWLDNDRYGAKRRYFRFCVQTPSGHTVSVELFRTKAHEGSSSQWRVWRVAD